MTVEKDPIRMVQQQFVPGARRIVSLGEAVGCGFTRRLGDLLSDRVAAGARCLVLYPMPRARETEYARMGLKVGPLGSGASVEVANYVSARRRLVEDGNPTGVDYGFILFEDIRPSEMAAAQAVMKVFPNADVLVVSIGAAVPPVCDFDAAVARLSDGSLSATENRPEAGSRPV